MSKTIFNFDQNATVYSPVELNAEQDARLLKHGHEPICIDPQTKKPAATGWSAGKVTPERIARERADFPHSSTGLRTGRFCVIDIDIVSEVPCRKVADLAFNFLGETKLSRRGSKGIALGYRNETPIKKISVTHYDRADNRRKPLIEILGIGNQLASFGIHPTTGRPYEWTQYDNDPDFPEVLSPLTVPLAALPEVTPDSLREFARQVAELLSELGYHDVRISGDTGEQRETRPSSGAPVSAEFLRKLLSCTHAVGLNKGKPVFDASSGYEEWRNTLAAIHSANIPGDHDKSIRKAIALEFSRGDLDPLGRFKDKRPDNYVDDADVENTFNTLPPKEGGISVGTLIYLAREAGHDNLCATGGSAKELFPPLSKALMAELHRLYPVDECPVIRLVEGELSSVVDQAEAALAATYLPIYQFSGALVRPVVSPYKIADRGEASSLRLVKMTEPSMVEVLTRAANFQRYDQRAKRWVPKDCPDKVAKAYLARGDWNVPVLTGIVHAPTLSLDGRLLDVEGYDAGSGLLFNACGVKFPAIPSTPTRDDALAALKMFTELLSTFEGMSPASRAVALSGMLTPLVRRSLKTVPLHAMNAPTAGSGKSMLVDMAALIATGKPAPVLAQSAREEENEKRLAAEMMAGSSIISFDNCSEPISGDFLCQVLTQQYVKPRVLGLSKNVEILSNATLFTTGNNLAIRGDVTRRTIMASIDPGVERPELRKFASDPRDVILGDRPSYVAAGLTILRAYILAGQPAQSTPLGGFESWSGVVRDALLWLGEADPCDTMEALRETDDELIGLVRLFDLWEKVIGTGARAEVTVRNLIASTGLLSHDRRSEGPTPEERSALLDLLRDIAGTTRVNEAPNPKAIGAYLRRYKGRVVNGRKLVTTGSTHGTQRWRLTRVA